MWRLLFPIVLSVPLLGTPPEWRNIRDFGAVGDGVTDDSDAIQAAFNSLDPVMGGTVYCSPGTYAVYKQITVTTSSVRFIGDGGSAFNEDTGKNTGRGCSLWGRSNNMVVLKFDGGPLNFRGPAIEYVNFRDVTPAGNSAVLVWIYRFTRWTVRNVYLGYADIGLKVDSGPPAERGDASWGYASQVICKNSNTCIEEPNQWGGFLLLGGSLEPLVTGVRASGNQVRIVGVKFDCVNGGVGVSITGGGNVVDASMFEQCSTSIKLRGDNSGAGSWNRILGNHFRQWDGGASIGVDIGPNCSHNQLFGNTYEYFGSNAAVNDQGRSTKRYEQGIGANATLTCGSGQAVKSITVKEGIVTGVNCGAP